MTSGIADWRASAISSSGLAFLHGFAGRPVILGGIVGEDAGKILRAFRAECKCLDTSLCAVLFFDGLPPRPQFSPDGYNLKARLSVSGLDL
jgi:hypothetical protein